MGGLHVALFIHVQCNIFCRMKNAALGPLLLVKLVHNSQESCHVWSLKNDASISNPTFYLLWSISFRNSQLFKYFVITLLKWMKYKNRLAFAYYSITFWDFKSHQSVPKTWQVLEPKYIFLKDVKIWKYRFLWFQIAISLCFFQ